MKRIILLRFHKSPEIVQNRIDILKHFNSEIPIYGLFGGDKKDLNLFGNLKEIENIHYSDIQPEIVKWKNGDICVLRWYEEYGKNLDFDVLHIVEWDFLILEKLEKIYKYKEGENHIYLTCPTPLEKVMNAWFWFIHPDFSTPESIEFVKTVKSKFENIHPNFPANESKEFVKFVEDKYGLTIKDLYATEGPGTTYSRKFLEGYSELDLPDIGHDELRIPAIAKILNIEFRDTKFVATDWFDETSIHYQLFNCDKIEIAPDLLLENYQNGMKNVFHPYYSIFELKYQKSE